MLTMIFLAIYIANIIASSGEGCYKKAKKSNFKITHIYDRRNLKTKTLKI